MRLLFSLGLLAAVLSGGRMAGPSSPEISDRDTTRPRPGAVVFNAACYSCHKDSLTSLAPGYSILASMTPRAILAALDKGKMRAMAAGLSEEERRSVSEWITRSKL